MKNVEFYNSATQLLEKGNYDEAISLFDSCLCNNPDPQLTFLSYWNLALAIFEKYNFNNRDGKNISNTEMLWCIRMVICAKNVKNIFDSKLDDYHDFKNSHYAIYNNSIKFSKNYAYYGSVSANSYGSLQSRNWEDVRKAHTKPLKCIEIEERDYFL